MPITSTLFTPVLAVRRRPLGCREISGLLFTSFPKPCTDARRVILLMLRSVHGHFTYGEHNLVPDVMLDELIARSDLIMALARRLEDDLKNELWTGELAVDLRSMYSRIFNKLVTFLLDTAGGDLESAVEAVRASYAKNVSYLLNVPDWVVEHDLVVTAHKYDIAYVKTATIEDRHLKVPEGSQGPMVPGSPEPAVCKGLLVKIKTGLKKKLWGKKEPVEEGVGEPVELSAATPKNVVSGYESGSDSGVSVSGSDEVREECQWGWWGDEEE